MKSDHSDALLIQRLGDCTRSAMPAVKKKKEQTEILYEAAKINICTMFIHVVVLYLLCVFPCVLHVHSSEHLFVPNVFMRVLSVPLRVILLYFVPYPRVVSPDCLYPHHDAVCS